MILLIACILISGYLFYRKTNKKEPEDKLLVTFFTLLGLSLGALVSFTLALFFSNTMLQGTEHYEFEKTKLLALGSTSELHGSFFLASGSIGAEQFYKFYYETPNGGKKFGKVDAESVTIYEEDRKDAFMSKSGSRKLYSNQVYLWLVPKFSTADDHWEYVIHVPKGTIKVEYNLDLK